MPASPQPAGERAQVVDRAEVGAHRSVVGDRVPAVAVARPGPQQRHQVQVGDAEFGEVVQMFADARQRAGEPVGVGGVAEHPGLLEPVGLQQPAFVEPMQIVVAGGEGPGGDAHESVGQLVGSFAVQRTQPVHQVVPPAVQPQREAVGTMTGDVGEHLRRQPMGTIRRGRHRTAPDLGVGSPLGATAGRRPMTPPWSLRTSSPSRRRSWAGSRLGCQSAGIGRDAPLGRASHAARPISAFDNPSAISLSTSSSRAVNPRSARYRSAGRTAAVNTPISRRVIEGSMSARPRPPTARPRSVAPAGRP